MIPQRSTNLAQPCLTSEIGRDRVFSEWYDSGILHRNVTIIIHRFLRLRSRIQAQSHSSLEPIYLTHQKSGMRGLIPHLVESPPYCRARAYQDWGEASVQILRTIRRKAPFSCCRPPKVASREWVGKESRAVSSGGGDPLSRPRRATLRTFHVDDLCGR